MRVLYVDQFGKKSGCYSIPQAEYIYLNESIDIRHFVSDNIDFDTSKYHVNIIKGFHGAYEGNALNKAKNYLIGLLELEKYVRSNDIDILHLQWFSLPWIEWIFVKRIKRICKVVITVHDVIPFDRRPLEMQSLDLIYKNADYLLFHTEYARSTYESNYSARTKSAIITQGFCQKIDYKIVEKKRARLHLGIPNEKIVFLYYGTIRQSKGLDVLIKAFKKAFELNPNIFFLAGGSFQKVDEREYRELVDSSLNTCNSLVKFEFIPTEEEPFFFCAADVICLPYREITQSGVAQNALVYELPIVATDIGEMKDVVRDGFNGELFDVDDQDKLSTIIGKMANNPDLIEKYSDGSKYLSENVFSLKNKCKIVADVYRELCTH